MVIGDPMFLSSLPPAIEPGPGLEPEFDAMRSLFERDLEARTVMACARRAGIPYSEAVRRWSTASDIAAELALDAMVAADAADRCPDCGVKPDEILDPDTRRELDQGAWKVYGTTCWMCATIARARKGLDDKAMDNGFKVGVRPREPGDPFVDMP